MKPNFQKIKKEQVVLVNPTDEVIGQASVYEAHRGQGQLHRACSVFLFNDQGELLIQQRSAAKIVAAGQWANTACGNVRLNESYQDCALRRLKDELGIEGVELTKLVKFQYQVKFDNGFIENEIDTVFRGSYNAEPQLNPKEVSAVDWLTLTELQQRLSTQPTQFAPWLKIILAQPKIINTFNSASSAFKNKYS